MSSSLFGYVVFVSLLSQAPLKQILLASELTPSPKVGVLQQNSLRVALIKKVTLLDQKGAQNVSFQEVTTKQPLNGFHPTSTKRKIAPNKTSPFQNAGSPGNHKV